MKADRYNEGKPVWTLLHFKSLIPLVRVMEYGWKKYSRDNWKRGLDKQEILDSLTRHLAALIDGEDHDKESSIHHIGHIMANCMFYSYHHVDPEKVIKESNDK